MKAQPGRQANDSLKALLQKTRSDTARLRLLKTLLLACAQTNHPEEVAAYGEEALSLSELSGNRLEAARVQYALGTAYLYLDDPEHAITALERSRDIAARDSSLAAKKLYALGSGNLSNAYSMKGFDTKALELLIATLPVFEQTKDTLPYAITLHNIGNMFINRKEYGKAYPYLVKSIALMDNNASFPDKAGIFLTAAYTMYCQDSLDKMKYFLDKAEQSLQHTATAAEWSVFYTYEAGYYTKQKAFARAQELCRRAIALQAEYPNRNNLYNAYSMLQANYSAQNDFGHALACADTIYRMAGKDQDTGFLLSSLHDLSELSAKTGHIADAYQYLSAYTVLKDSTDAQQTLLKLSEMEMRYQSAQKEQQILQLRNHAKIQKLLFYGLAALALLMLAFLLYWLRQKRAQTGQQLQSLNQQREIAVTQALLTGEERERSRLARDLHDGLGGMLAGVKMNLSRIAEKAAGTLQDELHETVHQLGDSVNELRHIARNMMPESLLRSGLQGALRDLCESYMTPQRRIALNIFNVSEAILPQHQLMIYRLIQEIISNAVKHSGAHRILVQCTQAGQTFFITVEDNGKGFEVNNPAHEGMGLKNIRNRVNFLKGNIHIDSSAEGAIINIELNVTHG
ncbi:MAG TPA: sensor histidine kinase [Chitinophaga sp.]